MDIGNMHKNLVGIARVVRGQTDILITILRNRCRGRSYGIFSILRRQTIRREVLNVH